MKNNFSIGSRMVGYNKPCFFIAEIGPNHNGSLENAKNSFLKLKNLVVML